MLLTALHLSLLWVLFVNVFSCSTTAPTIEADLQTAESGKSVVGDLHLHQFNSKVFGNTRMIRVLVPHGYNERPNQNKRYAVLYLNDGQNLFDSATSVFNALEWQVDETLDRLVRAQGIEPLIVVGVDNAGRRQRENEYLIYPDAYLRPPLPNPEGSKYPTFLIDETFESGLKEFILVSVPTRAARQIAGPVIGLAKRCRMH